jgi:hypothetical protein
LFITRVLNIPESSWLDWLVALLLASCSAGVVFWQNARLAVLWDLSYILENSHRIALGDLPYRDFPFPYPPLTFLVQAILIKISGRVFFHHVIYCAVIGGLATLITWRILLHTLSGKVTGARALALLLTLPLTVLGIYGIYPHPFYDPDCTFSLLVCLFLLQRWERKPALVRSLLTGAVLVMPLFIKQNAGLAFLVTTIFAIVLLLLIGFFRQHQIGPLFWLLLGTMLGLISGALAIQSTVGLREYLHWTITFAAARRTPAFADMVGIYRDGLLKGWLMAFFAGFVLLRLKSRLREIFKESSLLLISLPFVWPVAYLFFDRDSSERAERLLSLWPFLLIIGLVSAVISVRRLPGFSVAMLFILLATVHGAFLSQQLWGSTYALWPLFLIILANTYVGFSLLMKPLLVVWPLFLVISCALLISGTFYMRSHERLDYADLDEGELVHSKLPALRGLSMRGAWITDFEELVEYAEKEIPRQDGILIIPGEDLFYYTTGRRPRLPALMFDHTVNPYSPEEILTLVRSRDVQWLIVKDELQLEEEPVEQKDVLMKLLLQEFEEVESLNNYEVYQRKSAESDEEP